MNGSIFKAFLKILMDFPNYFQGMEWRVHFVDIRKKSGDKVRNVFKRLQKNKRLAFTTHFYQIPFILPITYAACVFSSSILMILLMALCPMTTVMAKAPGFRSLSKISPAAANASIGGVRFSSFRKPWTFAKLSTDPWNQPRINLNWCERPMLLVSRVTRSEISARPCWYWSVGKLPSRTITTWAGLLTQALM